MAPRRNIMIYLIFFLLLSKCDGENARPEAPIFEFYRLKSQYLNNPYREEGKMNKDSLDAHWSSMVSQKQDLISTLLSYEHKGETSLYGEGYEGWTMQISYMPDSVHALYMIECLIQEDYLFNRRYRSLSGKLNQYKNDGLNFICSSDSIPELDILDFGKSFDNSLYSPFITHAWLLYKEHSDWDISPLSNSNMMWYHLDNTNKLSVSSNDNTTRSRAKSCKLFHHYFSNTPQNGHNWSQWPIFAQASESRRDHYVEKRRGIQNNYSIT